MQIKKFDKESNTIINKTINTNKIQSTIANKKSNAIAYKAIDNDKR